MKVIQLGGTNDALCQFVSLGGYHLLLDCGIHLNFREDGKVLAVLPDVERVEVGGVDILLLSNHSSTFALPFLVKYFGFRGKIYATAATVSFGRAMLNQLLDQASNGNVIFTSYDGSKEFHLSPSEIAESFDQVIHIEYKEVLKLQYNIQIIALSSGFCLGASIYVIEGGGEKLAYVPAASGDLNRHPKELDLTPLANCETLFLTDLKPDRDPHATTEYRVEQLLASVTQVLDRGGICIFPCSPTGTVYDLIEAVSAVCLRSRQHPSPMVLVSSLAKEILELIQVGPEWLCEKKIERLYAGEDAFPLQWLVNNNVLHLVPEVTPQLPSLLQNGGVVFADDPTLRFGPAADVIRMFGEDTKNAVLLIDPTIDPNVAVSPLMSLPLEKMACPIDARLSCGDANQFVTRCAPTALIVPYEYTVAPDANRNDEASRFIKVAPLSELIVAKPKTELQTVPIKRLEPVQMDKGSKYIDGWLDPELSVKVKLTQTGGKAVGGVRGVFRAEKDTFILEELGPQPKLQTAEADPNEGKKVTGKRKSPGQSTSYHSSASIASQDRLEFQEQSSLVFGTIDEEYLMRQIKKHDPSAQVFATQGPHGADVLLNIPSMEAKVTLWKDEPKTLVETNNENARNLLSSLITAQLVTFAPY